MSRINYRYVYGPVPSWRLGSSLGVDPISAKHKICSFDCMYCQLGKTRDFSLERRKFVPTRAVVEEIRKVVVPGIDYITFSGAGEPTLAKNLGGMIRALKKIRREKIAVITNASLMNRKDVRRDLSLADFVLAKLDADSEALFRKINRPMPGIRFGLLVPAVKKFRTMFRGRLALQIMFTAANVKRARSIARLAQTIAPDEIQLNTPLRPCGTKPISKKVMRAIENIFRRICSKEILIVNVYRAEKPKVTSISAPDTLRRRGKTL